MAIKRINPTAPFAMAAQDDITTKDLTDCEFRVYIYYRSHKDSYNLSAAKTAKKLKKSKRTIDEVNKSLILKGYLAIMGHTRPTYFIGLDQVEIALKKHANYFINKKKKNKVKSDLLKANPILTTQSRLKGSMATLDSY